MSLKALTGIVAALLIASPAAAQVSGEPERDVLMWYQAFDQNKPELLDQLLAPTWVDIPSPPEAPPGPAMARQVLVMLRTSFPDMTMTVEDVIRDGDKVVVRATLRGTHRQSFAGIPATGRALEIQVVDIHQFENGRIARTWHTEDWMTGLNQMGAFGP